jgi:hypothetical protein
MPFQVVLEKLSGETAHLRTAHVRGEVNELPVVGRPLWLSAPPLDPAYDSRLVMTTPIQSVESNGPLYLFTTISGSRYRLMLVADGVN